MSNQVHITSKHIIKPSSPTPPHLQTYKLSLLNQLIRPEPTPIHLLFRPSKPHDEPSTQLLKRSLATVLTRFYPLAGVIINNTHIHCNDRGAIYYDAYVDCPMSHFLNHPPDGSVANSLKLVIPKMDDQDIITVVQVTTFSCGSVVICLALSHKIADAAACATFLKCWGAITRGAEEEIRGVVFDSCHVFPPLDPSSLGIATKACPNSGRENSLATKHFVFTLDRISALQDKLASDGYRPSRIVALTTLIWGSYIRVIQQRIGHKKRVKHVATHAIDLRGRVNPNLPGDSLDNLIESSVGAEWAAGSTHTHVDLAKMARLMYEDIKRYDDPVYVKRIHLDGSYVNQRREIVIKSGRGEIEWFKFTSNCRVPFYDVDFGWGRPCWAVSALIPVDKLCVLLDAPPGSGGGGVEAWVTLLQQDMDAFEKDPFFMAYVDPSCSHPISNISKL